MKHELQNIISGKSPVGNGDTVQTISHYLRESKSTSETVESSKQIKLEEATFIKEFCQKNNFWIPNIDINTFVSSGAEQKVYLLDTYKVIKLNDSIYYETWLDYFNNLLLNNYFFPDTAYQLIGFYESENVLYAVVEQSFIESDCETELEEVKSFLTSNCFINKKNNDYFHPELGIILEDLHDENVLTYKDSLFFIDTVFISQNNFIKNNTTFVL
ncbi:hypothetical protein [Flavobacterium sp.]|uniref:putative polyvalent protein kinase domain-containing protein n=1 Tax=Flavobacterium sp. TaxID=239 RepID=UPI00286E517E|nr:hypothetical protein [Flavobacterium sp.]